MPPCHGGDRRFESGRARQEAYALQNTTFIVVFLYRNEIKNDKKHVGMNETDYSLVNLSESEPSTKLHTSALAGCLAVAAVFELDDKVALFLSHHPPSGNQIEAAKKL